VTEQAQLVKRYLRLRRIGRQWNNKLCRRVSKEAIDQSSRRLHIMQDDVLVFETEDETAILMDYALYDYRGNGRTLVERFVAESLPSCSDPDQRDLLKGMSAARYSLYQIREVVGGLGVGVADLLRHGNPPFIVDMGLGQTAEPGYVLAGRVLPFDTFAMTTGAGLPVDADTLQTLVTRIKSRMDSDGYLDHLSAEQWSDLTAKIICECLLRRASSRIAYTDAETFVVQPEIPRRPQEVGRNEPCPCGSGKKFKKCCGRPQ